VGQTYTDRRHTDGRQTTATDAVTETEVCEPNNPSEKNRLRNNVIIIHELNCP